jgi:hypothetical protein
MLAYMQIYVCIMLQYRLRYAVTLCYNVLSNKNASLVTEIGNSEVPDCCA